METILLTALGIFILITFAYDAHVTILNSRGRNGPVSQAIFNLFWLFALKISFRLSPSERHRHLNSIGPLFMPILVGIYLILCIFGFALIYYPRMPHEFIVTTEATSSRWIQSLYFSGVTLMTVGYGDVSPLTPAMRLTSFVEAAVGLGFISLTITYIVTVYRALERKRTVALGFYLQAEEGANVVAFILNHQVAEKLSGIAATLRSAARDLQETLESHLEHPVIHYFHPIEIYKGQPRVLYMALEICAVIRSCLDRDEYSTVHDRAELRALESSALHVLDQFGKSLRITPRPFANSESERMDRWRKQYESDIDRLSKAGIKTQSDVEAGLQVYISDREQWESKLNGLARYLGYEWDEVTGG